MTKSLYALLALSTLFSGYEPRMKKLRSAILEAVPSAQVEGALFAELSLCMSPIFTFFIIRKGWKENVLRGDGQ